VHGILKTLDQNKDFPFTRVNLLVNVDELPLFKSSSLALYSSLELGLGYGVFLNIKTLPAMNVKTAVILASL